MIEVMGLNGFDYSDQCEPPNLGILAVRYPVEDTDQARATLLRRGGQLWRDVSRVVIGDMGEVSLFSVKTPDGAIMQFFAPWATRKAAIGTEGTLRREVRMQHAGNEF